MWWEAEFLKTRTNGRPPAPVTTDGGVPVRRGDGVGRGFLFFLFFFER